MRAVNLMPDSGRGASGSPTTLLSPANGVIALLLVALALVTVYVVSSNSVSSRKAKLATVQQQVQAAQAQANQLNNYVTYQKLALSRVNTIQQLAGGRFDWHSALANLSRVVPANAAFQALLATATPNASVAGAGGSVGGGAGTGSLRSDIATPAFEIKGCTASHDDVARLISRLRVMPDVQRVTLADSVKAIQTPGSSQSGASKGPTACGHDPASFDLVIFFAAPPGSDTTSATGAAPVSTPAGAAASASSATTTTSTTTTATTSSASSTASAQPVSTGSSR